MIRSPTLSTANPTQVHHTTWGVTRRYIRRPSGKRRPADTGTAALAWSLDADTVSNAPISATGPRRALPHWHNSGTSQRYSARLIVYHMPASKARRRSARSRSPGKITGEQPRRPLITDRRAEHTLPRAARGQRLGSVRP